MESDACSLFVFLLLDRSRPFWQQLAEREIRFTQSIDLGRFDTVANESQNGGTPFVPLRFVLADVLWLQRLVFRLFLGARVCSRFHQTARRWCSTTRCSNSRRSSSLGIVSIKPSIMRSSCDDDDIVVSWESIGKICNPRSRVAADSARRDPEPGNPGAVSNSVFGVRSASPLAVRNRRTAT